MVNRRAEIRRSKRIGRPSGLTLLEMFLTLALLAIIAGLAWPALEHPFANQRLKKAADAVRTTLVSARVCALESGRIYQFLHTPGSNRYRIERQGLSDTSSGSTSSGSKDATALDSEPSTILAPAFEEYTLPESIVFVGADGSPVDAAAITALGDSDATNAAWAEPPVLFHPDGTTADARITLQNDYGDTIELTLRGLTGVVLVGEPTAAEEGRQ